MRELILLRHAQAEPALPGQADFDRPLALQGGAEASAAGRWISENKFIPDRVLCSPARRTRETLEGVLAVTGDIECHLESSIYEATAGTLMHLADAQHDVDRLLLIGHNPGLERLVALLNNGRSGEYRGMPPGGVVVLSLPNHGPIEPSVASMLAFWWP